MLDGDTSPVLPNGSQSTPCRATPTPKLRRRKSSIEDNTTISQRLVEYFVVVSCQPQWTNNKTDQETTHQQQQEPRTPNKQNKTPPKENIHMPNKAADYTFSPKITARYPMVDYPDNPLNPMVVQFCFPQSVSIVPSQEFVMSRIHHFVLTNEKGTRIYGTCLTSYEEYFPADLNDPYYRRHKIFESSPEKIEIMIDEASAGSSCEPLYIPRVLCILSSWPYLYAFREYLAQLYRLSTSTTLMEAPLERYVQNICLEIPAPPPGAFEIELSILQSQIKFWAPPAKLPIPYVSVPYSTLFECLDLDNVMAVWLALLTEQKVLLLSSQYSILTMCAETLSSLLFPLQWSHLYIPLLPRFLSPMLDAPIPYLVGVIRENWVHAENHLSPEAMVVDLDCNKISFGPYFPEMVSPPTKKWTKLKAALLQAVGDIFWKIRGLERESYLYKKGRILDQHIHRIYEEKGSNQWKERLHGFDDAFSMAYTPDSPNLIIDESLEEEEEQQSSYEQVQEAFLRFFVSTFKDYRKFLNTPDLNLPELNDAKNATTSTKHNSFLWNQNVRSFDRDGFVAWQKAESQHFFEEITITQQFDDFITKRLYSPGEPDVIFFDQSIDSKLNRSKLRMKKLDTPFLLNAKAHKILKTVQAVAPSTEGIENGKTYHYESWPEEFDTSLFGAPRPIPKMITSEFDRQSALVAQLRSMHVTEEVDVLGGNYDSSPEVATSTLFFFTYGAVIGLDWLAYEETQQHAEQVVPETHAVQEKISEEGDKSSPMTVTTAAETGETMKDAPESDQCLPSGMILNVPDCIGESKKDCDMNLCSFQKYYGNGESPDNFFALWDPLSNDVRGKSLLDMDYNNLSQYEIFKAITAAQFDLAFDALETMSARGLPTDPDAFKSLMEACGRCGNTDRAMQLIKIMKRDGFVADREIYSYFLKAFETKPTEVAEESHAELPRSTDDAYCAFLEDRLNQSKAVDPTSSNTGQTNKIGFASDDDSGVFSTSTSSEGSLKINADIITEIMNTVFTPMQKSPTKKKRRRPSIGKSKKTGLPTTPRVQKQVQLGDNLLAHLYPDLSIDPGSDVCPHCSTELTEDDIVIGWKPCEFQDYTTACPQCKHRFVPHFTIRCSSSHFLGSQGKGTPLYCEFLSPWVLRNELEHIVHGKDGVKSILNPKWRQETDIQATLWWNLIVCFKRFRLPFSFLLQESFQTNLINTPTAPERHYS